MTAPPTVRLPRLAKGVGALLVLAAVVVGVPLLMAALHLVPTSIPSWHQIATALRSRDDGHLAGGVLAAGVWICWALFVLSLPPEIAGVLRHRPARTLPGLGLFQRPAAALVAAVAIGFTLAPVTAGRAQAVPPPLPVAIPTALAAASTPSASVPASTGDASVMDTGSTTASSTNAVQPPSRQVAGGQTDPAPTQAADKTYLVQRRDTLWGIAERYLHDPLRYPEITRLNPTVVGPDNELRVGSLLRMPDDATDLPPAPEAPATGGSRQPVTVQPGDTLWGIEQRLTGDGRNWPTGWQANQGRAEPDGAYFTDPDQIRPGWTLDIPIPPGAGDSSTETGTPPPAPDTQTTPDAPTNTPPSPAPETTSAPTSAEDVTPAPTPTDETTRTPATRTPSHARPTSAPASADRPDKQTGGRSELPMLAFAGGGGLLLAGVSLTALTRYRRRQFRRRLPGRIIAGTPAKLIDAERTVMAAGRAGAADVTWLDQALRSLVQTLAGQPGARLPDVIAACLTDEELTLALAAPMPTAPAPWRTEQGGTRWVLRRENPVTYDASRRGYFFAPFPTLASVGYTVDGAHWLLDLERIATLSMTGDTDRCLNLARFLAAELGHNTWSEMLQVTLVGFGRELVAANPDRLSYTDDLPGATAALSHQLTSVTDAMQAADLDVLTGRLYDIAGDHWAAHVLLVAPHLAGDTTGLEELLAVLRRQPTRASVALVLADDPDGADARGWQLSIDRDGMLTIPALGAELIAEQLPAEEAEQLAQMLSLAAISDDQPVPSAHGDQPWDAHADACGGLTVPPPAGEADRPAPVDLPPLRPSETNSSSSSSVLPLPPQTYLTRAATTEDDLRALAPDVTVEIRAQVEQADPCLDADLAAWHEPHCPRPRVTLLGPVGVRAQGKLPERGPQEAFHTEVVAYLATRPAAVPSNVYAETMWSGDPDVVGKVKVRQSITAVRKWLGRDPHTGAEYLPSGLHGPSPARYRIVGALVDAELFRRLRVRGLSRGEDGIDDLWRALGLVSGPPFADIPAPREGAPGGYAWLTDANVRLDHEYSAMIVDVAHTVAIHHLAAAEPELAAQAGQLALQAGSYEDVPLLDLVRACLAQGKTAEAESYVRQILANHDAEIEEDLPPRTAQVLLRLRRQWDQAS